MVLRQPDGVAHLRAVTAMCRAKRGAYARSRAFFLREPLLLADDQRR
jgi:hypothetical protein